MSSSNRPMCLQYQILGVSPEHVSLLQLCFCVLQQSSMGEIMCVIVRVSHF